MMQLVQMILQVMLWTVFKVACRMLHVVGFSDVHGRYWKMNDVRCEHSGAGHSTWRSNWLNILPDQVEQTLLHLRSGLWVRIAGPLRARDSWQLHRVPTRGS